MANLIRGDGRTVNAYQDSIMGDFAFGGKDGIIKNVGQACGLDTTVLNSVTVKSGMVVMQGRQISLDGTDSISLPVPTGSTVYWTTLYLELDMSANTDDGFTGKVTLKKREYTASYPAVPTSDNLKIQTAGKAYLGLYRFKNTTNGITESAAIAETIDSGDLSEQMAEAIDDINARLDSLGFKQGAATISAPLTAEKNVIYKQGKYVYGHIKASVSSGTFDIGRVVFTIPEEYRYGAKAAQRLKSGTDEVYGAYIEQYGVAYAVSSGINIGYIGVVFRFFSDGAVRGEMYPGTGGTIGDVKNFDITFGYETE